MVRAAVRYASCFRHRHGQPPESGICRSGRQAVESDDELVILAPGDAMIRDGAATGDYDILEPLTKTTLIVPHSPAVTLYSSVDGLGMSLGSYIRHRRLARSHDDLLFGSEPVAVVARRWGFASPAYFSRVFRDRCGMPPGRLRRQRG
jgi:hypothetical protein